MAKEFMEYFKSLHRYLVLDYKICKVYTFNDIYKMSLKAPYHIVVLILYLFKLFFGKDKSYGTSRKQKGEQNQGVGGETMATSGLLDKCLSNTTDLEKALIEHEKVKRVWAIEDIIADVIILFQALVEKDTRIHERAVKDPSFPYREENAKLKHQITLIIKLADMILGVCRKITTAGYEVEGADKLQGMRNTFANIDKLFEKFYGSIEFEQMHKKAIEEYESQKIIEERPRQERLNL